MLPRLTLYLLKVTEFCNLNCPYCYMFNLRDFSYRGKPKVMSLEVVETFAHKAAALAVKQGVKSVGVSLHGGEPLLAGQEWFRSALEIFRKIEKKGVRFGFTVQTNGVMLDSDWIRLFDSEGVSIGISMDGPRQIHDRVRVNFAGRGSYDEVVRGLRLVQEYPKVFGGVLCVIDPSNNGLEIYRHFCELGVSAIDFLWPLDYNRDVRPPLFENARHPYADYLVPIFDEWWQNNRETVSIRYFFQLIKNIFGARGGLDSLGGNPLTIVSIDSDGSIEPVDSLKACGEGFTELGLNVLRDEIDMVYDQPLFKQAIAGQDGLCAECKACPLHDICGGGYLPHRYSQSNSFDNPTIYCRDVWGLTTHILSSIDNLEDVRRFLVAQYGQSSNLGSKGPDALNQNSLQLPQLV